MQNSQNEIILYQPDTSIQLEVRIEDETVWLSQVQMAELFQTTRNNVTMHISNIFKEGELEKNVVCKEFLLTTLHGAIAGKTQIKSVQFYNLDVIISVGYRIKSQRGTQFRIWATRVIKNYLLKGYAVNQRIDRLERKMVEHDQKFDLLIKTSLPPKEGVFFEGQIFDAYVFVSDLIKSAKKSIVLIDNYIDESALLLLSKRQEKVSAAIYTKQISAQLQLDLTKHNEQYETVDMHETRSFHDRFLLIDNVVYHIGASLKDLGKKLFAFSKMGVKGMDILKNV